MAPTPMTYNTLIPIAYQKNCNMAEDSGTSLRKSLLQRDMWKKLQSMFAQCDDVDHLASSPVLTAQERNPTAQRSSPLARRRHSTRTNAAAHKQQQQQQRKLTVSPKPRLQHSNRMDVSEDKPGPRTAVAPAHKQQQQEQVMMRRRRRRQPHRTQPAQESNESGRAQEHLSTTATTTSQRVSKRQAVVTSPVSDTEASDESEDESSGAPSPTTATTSTCAFSYSSRRLKAHQPDSSWAHPAAQTPRHVM